MHALQAVGEALVRLSPESLRQFDLPSGLLDAVLEAKRISPSKHGGFKRQMQYIGKLMREIDAEPIVARLEELQAPSRKAIALHHLAEDWRQRLLADAGALSGFAKEFLDGNADDEAELRRLTDGARLARAANRPPTDFRALFRRLLRHIQSKAEQTP